MNLSHNIDNSQDILDSRDVIARIAELESDRDSAEEDGEPWDEDDADELAVLLAFAEEASGAADWHHGEQYIRESYFEEFTRTFADDIGAIEGADRWPNYCIDWEKAASELLMDYTSAEFDGVTYYYRA